jgi:hypothetical protein
MMTKDEALRMAIEALEEAKEQLGGLPQLDKLIQDCKEALATNKESSLVQSAQEPSKVDLYFAVGFVMGIVFYQIQKYFL